MSTINAAGFYSPFDHGLYVGFLAGTTNSDHIPTYLRALLGTGAKGSGWICSAGGTAQSDITGYGFENTGNRGTITVD